MKKKVFLIIVLSLLVAGPAMAVLITPTGVTASDYYAAVDARPSRTFDETGIAAGFGYYGPNTHDHVHWASNWLSDADGDTSNDWLIYDLGGVIEIYSVQIWNLNFSDAGQCFHGITEMDVWISSDADAANDPTHASWVQVLDDQAVALGIGSELDYSETFSWTQAGARYVKLDEFGTDPASAFSSIAEVRFNGVPEPATMTLLGMGSLALLRLRRKRD